MPRKPTTSAPRRGFLKQLVAGTGLGLGAMLTGCQAARDSSAGSTPRYRVLYSNGGLQTTWCKLGYDTAMLWGELLGLDVVWVDGELNPEKQREKIEQKLSESWDYCCFQTVQTDILADPVRQLKKRGIPVVSVDTLLVDKPKLRDVGVWVQVASNHMQMAESSTEYLVKRIGGRGKVIHIGGDSAHSGARDREKGFKNVIQRYGSAIEVVGGGIRWCNWKPEKAREAFDALLQQSREPIAGAFFHNDDMALACRPALAGTIHKDMVMTGVDGQKDGLTGIRDGRLAATTVNPTCMLHMMALVVGLFIVRNQEKVEDLPLEIPCPCPLVSKEAGNLEAMFYLSDPKHCLV